MLFNKISLFSLFATLLISASSYGQNMQDTTMIVNGVCGMCKMTIETAVEDLDGIAKVDWNKDTKILKLSYDQDKLSLEDINLAVNKAGYDTEYSTADEEAYQKLHGCCKYRDPEVIKSH